MKTLEMNDFSAFDGFKYVYAFIAGDATNSVAWAVHCVAFNDPKELQEEHCLDDDELEDILSLDVGQTGYNDCYLNVVRMR